MLSKTASIFLCNMALYMLDVTRGVPSTRRSTPLALVEKTPELENIELHIDSKRGRSDPEDNELEDDEGEDNEVGEDEEEDDKFGEDEGGDDLKDFIDSFVNGNTSDDSVPEQLDWREKGYVTQVENQGNGDYCWAFAAAGVVEGLHMKETGKLVVLSEQNLIDCVYMAHIKKQSHHTAQRPHGNNRDVVISDPSEHINHTLPKIPHSGGGGDFPDTFEYIKNYGIASNETYPFTGSNVSQCAENPKLVAATIKSYNTVTARDEEALKEAIATYGPVAVTVDATNFIDYNNSKGIFQEQCGDTLNHGMVAVGYGSENGKDYWILKNSWGPNWGEKGYMRLARNNGNMCGVATAAFYVT